MALLTQQELKEMHQHASRVLDGSTTTSEGTLPNGDIARFTYRRGGNWDVFVNGKYVGTVWYS